MTEVLTLQVYFGRAEELERAINQAEKDVHTATFRVRTGAGEKSQVEAAKQHLAALREQAEELESEWIGAQLEALRAHDREAGATFKDCQAKVEDALARRAKAIDAITKILPGLEVNLETYRKACDEIRLSLHPVMPNAGPGREDIRGGIYGDLGHMIAERLISAFVNKHLPSTLCTDWRNPFHGVSAAEFEAKVASQIRYHVGRLAPMSKADA